MWRPQNSTPVQDGSRNISSNSCHFLHPDAHMENDWKDDRETMDDDYLNGAAQCLRRHNFKALRKFLNENAKIEEPKYGSDKSGMQGKIING